MQHGVSRVANQRLSMSDDFVNSHLDAVRQAGYRLPAVSGLVGLVEAKRASLLDSHYTLAQELYEQAQPCSPPRRCVNRLSDNISRVHSSRWDESHSSCFHSLTHTNTQTHKHTYTHTHIHTYTHTHIHTYTHTHIHTYTHTHIHTYTHTHIHTYTHTHIHTYTHTHIHTYTHTHTHTHTWGGGCLIRVWLISYTGPPGAKTLVKLSAPTGCQLRMQGC